MAIFGRRRAAHALATIAGALAVALATGGPAVAGWEMHDFASPLGDKGIALRVAAKRMADVHLAIACDGDTGSRWRGVAVVEEPDSHAGLGMRGDVRLRFGDATSRDLWSVRTTEDGHRIYTAADATRLARRLLREEAKAPDAQVTIEIHGVAGKPVALAFPLTGLAAKIETLSKRCDDWDLKSEE